MAKRVWILLFLLSVSFNIAAVGVVAFGLRSQVEAQGGELRREGRLRRELHLSGAQEEVFNQLRETFQQERARQEAAIAPLREALVRELVADQSDSVRVDSLLGQIGQGQAQLQRSLVDRILQERAVLQPDQREAFARSLERRLLRAGERRNDGADSLSGR